MIDTLAKQKPVQYAWLFVHDELGGYVLHQNAMPPLTFKTNAKSTVNKQLRVSLGDSASYIDTVFCTQRERQVAGNLPLYFD